MSGQRVLLLVPDGMVLFTSSKAQHVVASSLALIESSSTPMVYLSFARSRGSRARDRLQALLRRQLLTEPTVAPYDHGYIILGLEDILTIV